MINPVKSVKNHVHRNRTKYVAVTAFTAGCFVTHRTHQWADFITDIVENPIVETAA